MSRTRPASADPRNPLPVGTHQAVLCGKNHGQRLADHWVPPSAGSSRWCRAWSGKIEFFKPRIHIVLGKKYRTELFSIPGSEFDIVTFRLKAFGGIASVGRLVAMQHSRPWTGDFLQQQPGPTSAGWCPWACQHHPSMGAPTPPIHGHNTIHPRALTLSTHWHNNTIHPRAHHRQWEHLDLGTWLISIIYGNGPYYVWMSTQCVNLGKNLFISLFPAWKTTIRDTTLKHHCVSFWAVGCLCWESMELIASEVTKGYQLLNPLGIEWWKVLLLR